MFIFEHIVVNVAPQNRAPQNAGLYFLPALYDQGECLKFCLGLYRRSITAPVGLGVKALCEYIQHEASG
jgi:hypothetical protein